MHVLLVTHQAPPHIGGVENLVELEARALAEAGHTVTWVTSLPVGAAPPPEFSPQVTLVRVPAWHLFERLIRVAYPLFSPSLLPVLWRAVREADVVHVHGLVFLSSWLALVIAWWQRKPSLLTDHGGMLRLPSGLATLALRVAIETLGRMSCRLAHKLVAYNQRVLDLLARLGGKNCQTLFLANPVDHSFFRPPTAEERAAARAELGWTDARPSLLGKPAVAPSDARCTEAVARDGTRQSPVAPNGGAKDWRPKVLFVGRLVEHKGMKLLLAARDERFDLAFCGPGDATQLGELGTAVEYFPPRPQADVRQLYFAADLLALPSYNEGFPVVIQEALSCGLPVVTTDDEGYRPYRGLAGLSFCDLTAESVRTAIHAALDDPRAMTLRDDAAALRQLFPSRTEWLERLFGGLLKLEAPGIEP